MSQASSKEEIVIDREYPDLTPIQADIARFKDTYRQYQQWQERNTNRKEYSETQLCNEQDFVSAGRDLTTSVERHLDALQPHYLDRAVASGDISKAERDEVTALFTRWEREQELRSMDRENERDYTHKR